MQHLLDIVQRDPAPEPWAEGEKIPWNAPDYIALLEECGFSDAKLYPSLTGKVDTSQRGLLAIVARKAGAVS